MPKIKILIYLYFIVLFLDAFGLIFPDIIVRKYTIYLPLPILLTLYFFSVKKVNIYYVIALIFTFLGVVFFNMPEYVKVALVCYAIGVFLYVMISFKQAGTISMKSIYIATIPFLIVYLVPLLLFSDKVPADVFNYIMLYAFFVGFFFLTSSLIYFNQKNKRNLWLFSSGIIFVISTIIHGYNMFFGPILTIRFFVIVTFLLMHYAMYRYVAQA